MVVGPGLGDLGRKGRKRARGGLSLGSLLDFSRSPGKQRDALGNVGEMARCSRRVGRVATGDGIS